MPIEEDADQVELLALLPVCPDVYTGQRRDGYVNGGLDTEGYTLGVPS
jgi:hypothetical protein